MMNLHDGQLESTLLTLQKHLIGDQGVIKEPDISLTTKFDGTRSQFSVFLNQVQAVIQMHPTRYPTDASRVDLVGTLLTSTTLSWFALELEKCLHC